MSGTANPGSSLSSRRYGLDWLRIIATAAIFLFHSGSPYAAEIWHFVSASRSGVLEVLGVFLLLWAMPLLFVISGISTAMAARTRSRGTLLFERVKRLLVPLAFGILVIVPPQVYIERVSRGQFDGSFLAFYPHYFNAPYLEIGGTANFAWMGLHLWYLLALFVFTLIALPLLGAIPRVAEWLAGVAGRGAAAQLMLVLLPAIPLALIDILIGPDGLGGWNMLSFVVYFLAGLLFASHTGGLRAISDAFRLAVPVAAMAIVAGLALRFTGGFAVFGSSAPIAHAVLHGLAGWASVIALIGLGERSLDRPGLTLAAMSEAVLPFYILHQTWIVVVAYLVDGVSASAWPKYALVLVLAVAATIAVYACLIRPFGSMRFLFGLRPA